MKFNNCKKYLLHIIRIMLASVYIFSGLVKGFDPMGTAIKVEEYLMVFSLDIFSVLSPVLAILLCAMELFIGLLLLLNIKQRFTAFVTLLITAGFTLTTLYIYIASPVSDCGCFGDAIKLSNAETFYKNIVLVIMAIAIYFNVFSQSHLKTLNSKIDSIYVILSAVLALLIPIQATVSIPAIDFLPYQIGSNIHESMQIPSNAEPDKYEVKLKYKNIASGEIVEFSDSDTTWYDDTKWEFVDIESKLIQKGFSPPIASFDITDYNGTSVYEQILNKNNIFFVVIYDASKLDKIDPQSIENMRAISEIEGVEVAVLTYDNIENISVLFETKFGFSPVFYNADNIQLKSMLRQSVGIFALQEGTIIGKTVIGAELGIDTREDIEIFYEQQQSKRCNYTMFLTILFISLIGSYMILKLFKR